MKLTFLGTGTSQGVPIIGCRCRVCTSADRRDRRLRTSAMIECGEVRLVIDAGPDFRYQMLCTACDISTPSCSRTSTRTISEVWTTSGRSTSWIFPSSTGSTSTARNTCWPGVRKDFDYAFAADKYRGVPEIELRTIVPGKPFRVKGVEVVPVSGHHSERFEVTGFRIGKLAYLTDFKTIADAEVEKLRGVEVLVVNALRFEPHYSHFNVAEALELIRRVAPREAYLTHMSHEIGLYAETEPALPPGVHLAYDMLEVTINEDR